MWLFISMFCLLFYFINIINFISSLMRLGTENYLITLIAIILFYLKSNLKRKIMSFKRKTSFFFFLPFGKFFFKHKIH